jgi:hypothetical protein
MHRNQIAFQDHGRFKESEYAEFIIIIVVIPAPHQVRGKLQLESIPYIVR